MKTSNSDSTTPVREDSYSLDEDASRAQRVDEGSPSEAGVSPAPSRDAPQTGKAGNAAIEPTPEAKEARPQLPAWSVRRDGFGSCYDVPQFGQSHPNGGSVVGPRDGRRAFDETVGGRREYRDFWHSARRHP